MERTAKFWDKHAVGYSKRPIKNMPAYEQTLTHTRRFLSKTDHVVELGCGTGSTALLLADNVAKITGTDISPKMIEIASGKVQDTQADVVQFKQSDACGSTLPKQEFDAVLAFNLLHLLEDLPGAIRGAYDLVKPGGVFISKTPCLGENNRFLKILVWAMRKVGYAPYVNFLSFEALDAAIRNAGFEILETGLYPVKFGSRFIVARKT